MFSKYDHLTIEQKWRKKWEEEQAYGVTEDGAVPKEKRRYILDMFPYPSAAGLHVGHPEGYSATDIYARYLRMNGFHVLHPMGWDAFGLPAENYAIKQGVHPRISTWKNIDNFRRQIKSIGFSYDWSREVNTADPRYYKWTQWFFLLLYKNGLAYRKYAPVNWCASCQTVLAREQVIEGKCERCKNSVAQKELEQWFFKITDYAERLLADLAKIDWPEPIKLMQRNWIGRSEGITITYQVEEIGDSIACFTTRPDTNFGATFIVVAPEGEFARKHFSRFLQKEDVAIYIEQARKKTELERLSEGRKKTGVFTGLYAVNNLNGRRLPIYISDFVLAHVGTGAVVGVPGHDMRDFEFARALGIEIIRVVVGPDGDITPITRKEQVQEEAGVMVNSDFLNGMEIMEAKENIMNYLEEHGFGKRVLQYKLRDWLISRQRYWGAPIPIIYCAACGEVPVPEVDLPVLLPEDVDFKPTGESPLKRSKSFHEVRCPRCGKGEGVCRESDTMDTFVCSSWYLYRYTDPHNDSAFSSKENMRYWLPVDVYVGGAEHAVMHLLYARFFCKVLHDLGYIDFDEPFSKLINQGLILAEDGRKMSKSWGNVINPDDVIGEYGADALRLYEMFMGPLEDAKPWSTQGIKGIKRFLEKVWNIFQIPNLKSNSSEGSSECKRLLHKTIKKVTEDIEAFKFNTAIAQLMILANELKKHRDTLSEKDYSLLTTHYLLLLAPFAPHFAEELWSAQGNNQSIFKERWPESDSEFLKEALITIVIQVNGKRRGEIVVPEDTNKEAILAEARAVQQVARHIEGREVKKEIYVQNKIINFVI